MSNDFQEVSLIRGSIGARAPKYSSEDWRRFEREVGISFPQDVVWMASRAPEFFIEVDVDEYPDPDYPDPRVERMRVRLPHPGMSRQELADRSSDAWTGFSPAISEGGVVSFIDESDPCGLWVDRTFPFRAYPEEPVMLPWGEDISGCNYFWVPSEGAQGWRLLLGAVDHAQWVDMSLLDLLEGLVGQEFVSPVLGEGYWSNASVEFVESESDLG